jgi:uncharacterized membrane protein
MTCVVMGILHTGHFPISQQNWESAWWPYALFLGIVFITGFNAAALTVRYFSVTLSQIMQKMSILLTVPFAVLAYRESFGTMKFLGVLLAVGSIVLVNWPKKNIDGVAEGEMLGRRAIWIPAVTWILSGVIECMFLFVQNEGMALPEDPNFMIMIFFTAGTLGALKLGVDLLRNKREFAWRNLTAGILLGIPNYGSIYFLLLALGTGLGGSFIFPVTNVSVILLTTFGALWLFQESLSKLNWVGIGFAVLAIWAISV